MQFTNLTLKVHTDLLQTIVSTRENKGIYQTNNLIKYVGVYYVLKSFTTSGVIQNYSKQRFDICTALNCTNPTFYKYIRECKKLGYLKIVNGNIVLLSMQSFSETFGSIFTKVTTINLDFTKYKFYHVLESAFLQVQEQERSQIFESKYKSQPELINQLETVVTPDNKGNYGKALQQAQLYAFKYGHQFIKELFYYNPFTTCNSKTLTAKFGFKSEQSIAYLKTKLQKNNLVKVKPMRVPSLKNCRVKHLFIKWDSKTKQTILILPDSWEYAPILEI